MGPGPADTLMASLPPVGWADVATKHDLDMRLEIAEHRLSARMEQLSRSWYFATVASVGVLVGLAETLSRLIG